MGVWARVARCRPTPPASTKLIVLPNSPQFRGSPQRMNIVANIGESDRCVSAYLRTIPHTGAHVRTVVGYQFLLIQSPSDDAHRSLNGWRATIGVCNSTRHTTFKTMISVLFCSPRAGHGGQVVVARGHGEASYTSYTNYRHGGPIDVVWLGRGDVGNGRGGRILENPRRCVSPPSGATTAWQCFVW